MDRDTGLRRTTAITGVLVAASLAGTLAVGMAARAADSTAADSAPPADSTAADGGVTPSDPAATASPSLSTGADDSGQATSGGS